LAGASDADLVLVTTPMTTGEPVEPLWLSEAAADSGYGHVRTEFSTSNDPVVAIADCVARAGEATLCMATHGRGALGTAILGSVAQRAVRELEVETFLVGPNLDAAWSVQGAFLVCHDGSARSNAILPGARAWAVRLQIEPVVVHVAHPLDVQDRAVPTDEIEAALAFLDHGSTDDVLRVVTDRHPPAGILGVADELSASMIALTTHGRTDATRRTLGGVAGAVIHGAPCPVLIRRPQALTRIRP
jgi:nucleotide-binding universal stress UspA family protein